MQESGLEVAAQVRQDGVIRLDERVYLSRPPLAELERLVTLKRAVVAYPSGNTTAIVFDQLLGADRRDLNERVMQTWKDRSRGQPEIEQCCFVTLPQSSAAVARVEMFGGEFCGNATRSVAWLVTGGKDYQGLIEVSGVDRPLEFAVNDGTVSVEMPLAENGELTKQVVEGTLVQLDGITQLVVTGKNGQEEQTARELLARLLNDNVYGLSDQPAVGVSYYDLSSGKAAFCVWVNAVDTVFDETACGSGTSAIGIALADVRKSSVKLPVVQPSGETITTRAVYRGDGVAKSTIAGGVKVLYDGEFKLS